MPDHDPRTKEEAAAYEQILQGAAFGLTAAEMKLARAAAITAIRKYGDEVGKALQRIKNGDIHNDHVAVQAAVEAIKLMNADKGEPRC